MSLQEQLDVELSKLCAANEQASHDRCQAVLLELSGDLEAHIGSGTYAVPGGYQRYLDERQRVVEQYQEVSRKGLMAVSALQEFLRSQDAVADTIRQADQSLSEHDKELAGQQARTEAAEHEVAAQRMAQEAAEQRRQEAKRSQAGHVQQLEARLETERQQLLAEHQRALDHKLKEQERLLHQGFQHQAEQLRAEIRGLQRQISQSRRQTCVLF
ncbi:guanylate-binding protein 1-like [Alligator mississippiensis]|uniref:Guanylate-binding protein 1-like n=1 Tax=Alligator mississippiensis TaxID=8496 RepID=A0A151MRM1_ALLMI|nr:guanylate-binding protein 1-like [Alligator mississippiensis]